MSKPIDLQTTPFKEYVYITEPDAIDVNIVKDMLPSTYGIIQGNSSFEGDIPVGCSTLIIRSVTTIKSSIKDKFPELTNIVRVGTGLDNIDLEFCSKEGISVYNAPGANADAASDYVIAMMFVALRRVNQLTQSDVESWNRFKFTGHSMSSQSIGIIGFGNIGKQIFHKLQGFNCKDFFIYDPLVKEADLPKGVTYAASVEQVLKKSSIVTLHVPLLPSTQYLINKTNLSLLASDTILLNASRGGIVNEADIIDFIHEHRLIYVADTVENEPSVNPRLLNNPNIIVTPHIASLTVESDNMMVEVAINNFLNHTPANILMYQ